MSLVEMKDGEMNKVGLWHGTVIKLADGRRFRVTKINPVNVKLMDEQGKDGYNYNRQAAERHIDEDQTWDGPKEKNPYEILVEAIESGITLGTAVKIKGKSAAKYPHIYVVIQCKSDGTFRMAKLGGEGGRYLRGFRVADLEIVDV